jgi:hypothetical protein
VKRLGITHIASMQLDGHPKKDRIEEKRKVERKRQHHPRSIASVQMMEKELW